MSTVAQSRWIVRADVSDFGKCGTAGIAIPAEYLDRLEGWPNRLLRQAHDAGVPIYVETDDATWRVTSPNCQSAESLTDQTEEVGPALAARDRPISSSTVR
jgi:hypothetical protein